MSIFDLGIVQHVIDQPQQMLAGAFQRLQAFVGGGWRQHLGVLAQQAGQPQNAMQRRAHLMTHGGQETAFDGIAALGQRQRLLALFSQFAAAELQVKHGHGVGCRTASLHQHQPHEDGGADAQVERNSVALGQVVEHGRQQHRNGHGQGGLQAHGQHHQRDGGNAQQGGHHHRSQHRVARWTQPRTQKAKDQAVCKQRCDEVLFPVQRLRRSVAVEAAGNAQSPQRDADLGRQPSQQSRLRNRPPQHGADQQAHRDAHQVGRARSVEDQLSLCPAHLQVQVCACARGRDWRREVS